MFGPRCLVFMQLDPDHLRQPPFWNKVYDQYVNYGLCPSSASPCQMSKERIETKLSSSGWEPSLRICAFSLLSESWRGRIDSWNVTSWQYIVDMCLPNPSMNTAQSNSGVYIKSWRSTFATFVLPRSFNLIGFATKWAGYQECTG